MAPRSAAAAAGAAAPPPPGLLARAVAWIKGHAQWALYNAVGAVLAIPLALKLGLGLLLRPRGMLYRKDRSALALPDPLPGLSHEWVETAPGVTLHVARTSKGSGKPLLLLVHGFPEAWFSWRHQMGAFRGEYEVVAIDMRGYNESSKPEGRAAYMLDLLASDVLALSRRLLQETGQEQLVLVGHDWGGNVCWTAAHLSPELFSKLIVMCCPHPACFRRNMDWDQFRRSWYVFAFQMPWLPELALTADDYAMLDETFLCEPFGLQTPGGMSREEVERYKAALGRPGAPTATANYYRALVDLMTRAPRPTLTRAQRRRLPMPVLLLWAEKDPALGQQLIAGTERYCDSLRVEVLQGCSHWAQQDQPAKVNALWREFLAA